MELSRMLLHVLVVSDVVDEDDVTELREWGVSSAGPLPFPFGAEIPGQFHGRRT